MGAGRGRWRRRQKGGRRSREASDGWGGEANRREEKGAEAERVGAASRCNYIPIYAAAMAPAVSCLQVPNYSTRPQLHSDLCCSHDAFNCLFADAGHCRFGSIDLNWNANFCTKLAHFSQSSSVIWSTSSNIEVHPGSL